jgi:hypothetical protein
MGSTFKTTAKSKKFSARAALLVGTSALAIALGARAAAADEAPAAPPSDPHKWQPFFSLGGKFGPEAGGAEVIGFDPVWQDLNSLLYVRIGLGKPSGRKLLTNVGVGYRTKIDGDWIGGFYAGLDTEDGRATGHTYTQGSLGFEAMSADWDVRLNGYMAFGDRPRDVGAGNYSLFIQDTRIAILKEQEFAYSGFEGEVGYRIFNTDNFDIRVFAGGFNFDRVSTKTTIGGKTFDLGPGTIAGPMGRAEFELFGLDAFGAQSRLTFTGQVSHDDVHGTTAFAGVELRIPLNYFDDVAPDQDDLDRRMVDDVRRRDGVTIAAGYSKPEPVIIYNGTITSEPTNTLYYVDNTLGAGSYADPTTLHDATARGPVNQFIVLTDNDGPTVNASSVTVQHGETVVGPGTFTVKGATSGALFTHTFAPGSGPVTVTSSDTNAITLATDTNLFGFTIGGTSTNAIYGHNVTDVVIGDLTVNGGGTIANGVNIVQDNGTSGTITVDGATITGVTNDGIHIDVSNATGSTATQLIDLTDIDATAGHDGVSVVSTVSGGSVETVNLGVHNSTLAGGNTDLYTMGSASGGATLTSTIVVDPTFLTGGEYGFVAYGIADGGTLTQNINLEQVYVSGTTYSGVAIAGVALNGGSVTQHVTMNTVTVDGSYYPMVFSAVALGTGSTATQTIYGVDVTATNGYYSNLSLFAYAEGGGTAHQTAEFHNVTATNSQYGYGVDIQAQAYEGGHVVQNVYFDNLTATGNYYGGVNMEASADNFTPGTSAVAAQYVTIFGSNLSYNGGDGIFAGAYGADDSISRQDLLVGYSTIDGNSTHGVHANVLASFYGAAEQHVTLVYDDISYNGFGGVTVNASAFALGSATQTLAMYGDDVFGNGGPGIAINANATFAGQVNQSAGIYYTYSEDNAGDGLSVSSSAYGYGIGAYSAYYSHIAQNVVAAYSNFSFNGRNGVEVQNYSGYGAQLNQTIYLFDDRMNHNTDNGVLVNTRVMSYGYYGGAITTNAYSDVYVVASSANSNGNDGIQFAGDINGPGYLLQTLDVINTRADYNGRTGLVSFADAENFYSLNIQYLNIVNSEFYDNALDGAAFLASQSYGPLSFGAAIQDVLIQNSFLGYNGRDGLYASVNATDFQGRAEQHFTIRSSDFVGNGGNGASFRNSADYGTLYSTYTCDTVQGLVGGCAFDRVTIDARNSDFSYNGGNGIAIYNSADSYGAIYDAGGRPGNPNLLTYFVNANNNGGDGLHIENRASNGSYISSYDVLLASHFDNNGGDGISIYSNATNGSTIVQKGFLYGVPGYESTANGNGGSGVHITADATGGTVQQLFEAYYASVSHNNAHGIYVEGTANDAGGATSVVAQYTAAIFSDISDNTNGYGIGVYGIARGANSIVDQKSYVVGSTVDGNSRDGFDGFSEAYDGAAANQYLYVNGSAFDHNGGDGIYLGGAAYTIASVQLGLNSSYTPTSNSSASYNGGDGIALNVSAHSGATAQQNAFLYYVDTTHNGNSGLSVHANADGYGFGYVIYYSHVTQNVVAAFDHFDDNTGNGIDLRETAFYGGAINKFVGVYDFTSDHNGGAGAYQYSNITSIRGNDFSFSTNITNEIYFTGGSMSYNGGNGFAVNAYNNGPVYAPAFFGGYSYLIQHTRLSGVDASYNGGNGVSVSTHDRGRYGLNAEYVTLSGSRFDHNAADGASFTSDQYYGPGSFGAALQQVTIAGSDFSYNGGDGLHLGAFASGRQGRAEQHFTVSNSTFDNNSHDGVNIYAHAVDGVYLAGHPCDTVQGLPGGCAFVRQNVVIIGGDISHNTNDGVSFTSYANNYGAIYGASGRPHSPTLELYGTSVDNNSGHGLNVNNHVSNASYLYQYVASIDSSFSHNGSDGIYSATYVGGGSEALQRDLVYSYHVTSNVWDNAGNGFKSSIEALGGSYARNVNIVQGVYLGQNGSFGFDGAVAYADGTSTGLQINAVYFNAILRNGDGIGLYSIGSGAQQISYIGTNFVAYNSFVGIYGEANFGAFQYVGVYTFGNNVHSNGTDYLFNAFGGATQILN